MEHRNHMKGFELTGVPNADVSEVAKAIVKVVDLPFGTGETSTRRDMHSSYAFGRCLPVSNMELRTSALPNAILRYTAFPLVRSRHRNSHTSCPFLRFAFIRLPFCMLLLFCTGMRVL
jgi:hypothetical protein